MTNEAIMGMLRQLGQDVSNVRTRLAGCGRSAELLHSALGKLENESATHGEVEAIHGDLRRIHQDVSKLLVRLERVEHDRR